MSDLSDSYRTTFMSWLSNGTVLNRGLWFLIAADKGRICPEDSQMV